MQSIINQTCPKPSPFCDAATLRHKINAAAAEATPFLWGIDYEIQRAFFLPSPLTSCAGGIFWDMNGIGNSSMLSSAAERRSIPHQKAPRLEIAEFPAEQDYHRMFDTIMRGLRRGDSFLANLTMATPVSLNAEMSDIFLQSKAPFRLLIGDEFICFSPEPFVNISADGRISTFPMKGTADASSGVAQATDSLMNNYKEFCEHNTIVDLMRNDLNHVAHRVKVERFRYLEEILTDRSHILQTSSEISGQLPQGWQCRLGDILLQLLPAGSISGAPKRATMDLIHRAECDARGWYTGVFGYFDGKSIISAVMIRALQRHADGKIRFHSGGGITINSDPHSEFEESIAKIYLPR